MKNLKIFYSLSLSALIMFCTWGCTEDKPDLMWQANILSFHFKGYESYPAKIEGSNITVTLPSEVEDVTHLVPVVEFSPGTTTNLQTGIPANFENPVYYKVIAENRRNQQTYTVIVNVQSGFTSNQKISSFTLADGTYSPLFTPNNNRTVAMTNEHVFVTSTAPGGEIYWMPNTGGSAALSDNKKLSKGTQGLITGGTFALSTVRTSGEAIYASNLAIGGTHTFRVYKWTNKDDPEPELFLEFPHNGENRRLGDAITIWGNLSTNGAIVAHDRNSGNTFYKFNVINGIASPTPEVIISQVGGIGSFGQLTKIDENNYLVTGSTIAPALVGPNGAVKHAIPAGVMEAGATVGATVFEYNKARYLATMHYSAAAKKQKLIIYDITGKDLVATFQSINGANITSRKKFDLILGEDVANGNLTGSTDILLKDGKVQVAGLAPNSGLVIYEFNK